MKGSGRSGWPSDADEVAGGEQGLDGPDPVHRVLTSWPPTTAARRAPAWCARRPGSYPARGLQGCRSVARPWTRAEQRRYLGLELFKQCRAALDPTPDQKEEQATILGAISAPNPTTRNHPRTPPQRT